MGSIFGKFFRITTFGESHGKAIGVVVDGCPAGLDFDQKIIQTELNRRRPGQSIFTTPRDEKDIVEVLSGVFTQKTLGTPIAMLIRNKDQVSKDYDNIKDIYRPSHADFTYDKKYKIRDWRGGGRSSNRESAARVAAGAIAKKLIYSLNKTQSLAWVSRVNNIQTDIDPANVSLTKVEKSLIRCPDPDASIKMQNLIEKAKNKGDSLGGVVSFKIENCPVGIGEPVFDKLTADLAKALISINATRSFEIGIGAKASKLKGSEHNDEFIKKAGKITVKSNFAGGVLGGISTGSTIYGKVSFKPTATILKKQTTVTQKGQKADFTAAGRHDPCVLPRAVPIVEAMINLVLADQMLTSVLSNIENLKQFFTAQKNI